MEPHEPFSHPAPDLTHYLARRSTPSRVPDAMLTGLQARLEAYRKARTTPLTPAEREAALHDPRWEIRCAAAEHLSASAPSALFEQALDDEEYCVRQAAVRALGRLGPAVPPELLQSRLRDDAWQVREMVLLTAREYGIPLPAALLEGALQDESAPVRQAAREIQETHQEAHAARERGTRARDLPSPFSRVLSLVERDTSAMSTQAGPVLTAPSPSSGARRRPVSPLKAGVLVATLLLAVGVLTAASFGLGWWSPRLGDSAQYTVLNQEQTINGVTVRLVSVYLDRGRTVVVYDILSPSADQPFLDMGSAVTSGYPQKTGALAGGGEVQIDKHNPRLRHNYTVYRPFAVPDATSTLTVTWTIEVGHASETLPKVAPQTLSFTFSFTAPFHQVDNQRIIDPFKAGAGA